MVIKTCQAKLHEAKPAPPATQSLAAIVQTYPVQLPGHRAERLARVKGRTALTMLNWSGSVPTAVHVFTVLVHNAMQYGQHDTCASPPVLYGCLSTTEAKQLLIDVTDPNPRFPDFDNVRAGEGGGSLASLLQQQLIVDLICVVDSERRGKTVRTVLSAEAVSP
ncbi:hypothetical protein [Streptomyces lancefieldiae]|uniref:Regulatory protein n=1 Tax=Streptomyces lancefieldiae TaxID=3075520 RepID=A0ABU3B5D2_9ACTN|nr:hypothetical protein [Streptomyces sp. DSM 40712]MDT0616216.1 hypothetical protein [Streptomyces sp. DSM 40712]